MRERAALQLVDRDGNGSITVKEAKTLMRCLPSELKAHLADLEEVCKEGRVSKVEFLQFCNSRKVADPTALLAHIREALLNRSALRAEAIASAKRQTAFKPIQNGSDLAAHAVAMCVSVIEAKGLPVADSASVGGQIDPYVTLRVGGVEIQSTVVNYNTRTPRWNARFYANVDVRSAGFLTLELWDHDSNSSDDFVGVCRIPLVSLLKDDDKDNSGGRGAADSGRWYTIAHANASFTHVRGAPGYNLGSLYVKIEPLSSLQPIKTLRASVCKLHSAVSSAEAKYDAATPRSGSGFRVATRLETPLLALPMAVATISGVPIGYGSVLLTDYRLVFLPHASSETQEPGGGAKGSSAFHGFSFNGVDPTRSPTAVPLQLVGPVDVAIRSGGGGDQKGGYSLVTIQCRDFRHLGIMVWPKDAFTKHLLDDLARRLSCCQYNPIDATTQSQLRVHAGKGARPSVYNVDEEMKRQRMDPKRWRRTQINDEFKVCATYPRVLYVPKSASDSLVTRAAQFRSKGRLVALTWYSADNGACIVRCAQPRVGVSGARSPADEALVESVRRSVGGGASARLVIVDCRSKIAAGANSLKGKGTESSKYYKNCKILFQDIANIHAVRASLAALTGVVLATSRSDETWPTDVAGTNWLVYLSSVIKAAATCAYYVKCRGMPVLVHCSDGWDRTAQVSSLAQMLLDPYYRTLRGFVVLIEKDWLSFGHKFKERLGLSPHPHEESPIFQQWIDAVWQVMSQFPTRFEFNEYLLKDVVLHARAHWYDDFTLDCDRDRTQAAAAGRNSASLWSLVLSRLEAYANPQYERDPPDGKAAILPHASLKVLRIWPLLYLEHDEVALGHLRYNEDGKTDMREILRKQSATKVLWVDDQFSNSCHDCGQAFTFLRRRHHCRNCGLLFCGKCSSTFCVVPKLESVEKVRVCDKCADQIQQVGESASA